MSLLPEGLELIQLSERMDHDVDIEVWIPDPYPARAMRTWPHLRGVKLILSLMAGTEWIPSIAGPHVTICNAHGAHNTSTAEWTVASILAMLKHFPLFLDIQRSGQWKRRSEVTEEFVAISGDTRHLYPPVMLEELTGKTVLLIGYGSMRTDPTVHAASELDSLIPRADVIVLILPSTAGNALAHRSAAVCAHAPGRAPGKMPRAGQS